MPSSALFSIVQLTTEVAQAATLFYASYWAFMIRRASAVPLYRNQALGLFLIAFTGGVSATSFALNGGPGNVPIFILVATSLLFVFYWVDVSVKAARRSDPLMRNIIGWSRLRMVLWPVNITFAILGVFIFGLLFVSAFLSYGVGALALSIAGRRSGDPTLRTHLKWFGLYAALTVFFFVILYPVVSGTISPSSLVGLTLGPVILAITLATGYSLYRSATSLAPLLPLPQGVRVQEN